MLGATASDNIADSNIVGWIEERHVGTVAPHESFDVSKIPRIAAQETMVAELPEVVCSADGWTGKLRRIEVVGWVRCVVLEIS